MTGKKAINGYYGLGNDAAVAKRGSKKEKKGKKGGAMTPPHTQEDEAETFEMISDEEKVSNKSKVEADASRFTRIAYLRLSGPAPATIGEFALDPSEWEECHRTATRELFAIVRDRTVDVDRLETYCGHVSTSFLRLLMNKKDDFGLDMLFYAIRRGDPSIVELCLKAGSDPETVCQVKVNDHGYFILVSPLIFAIAGDYDSPTLRLHSTDIVRYLLAYQSSPKTIPSALYQPPDCPKGLSTDSDDQLNRLVEQNILFSHRYLLDLAARLGKPTMRMQAKMIAYEMEELMRAPFFLIGQELAIKAVTINLVTHRMLGGKKPLVLAFAGPSGHGKTHLAQSLGRLLNLPLLSVSMNDITTKWELLGSATGYVGNQNGAPLANFLSQNRGRRCIVFLDEFEKTKDELQQVFLTYWQEGTYVNHKSGMKEDIAQVIWILATNVVDETIAAIFKEEEAALISHELTTERFNEISIQVKKSLQHHWAPSVTSRISRVVPFFAFTPMEAKAAASEASTDIRKILCSEQQIFALLSPDKELAVIEEVAKDYDPKEGHRSIAQSAHQKVGEVVAMAYLEQKEVEPEEEFYEAYDVDSRKTDNQIVSRRKAKGDVQWNGITQAGRKEQ